VTSADRGWLRRSIDLLGSGRLALLLLAALVILLILYLFIPQGDPVGMIGALGLSDIRHSGWLYGTCVLLLLNLMTCMIRRFRAALSLIRFPEEPPRDTSAWSHREIAAVGIEPREIARVLRAKGYRALAAGEAVYGLRGRFAVAGHWIFHVSLLLLIAVGVLVAAGPDPFRATIGLGEGETFDLHHAAFLSTNEPPSAELPDLRFDLQRIDILTEGEDVRRLEARLSTPEGEVASLGINRPFRKHLYQVMVHGFGYMPGWVIVDRQGRMLKGAWVKLVPFPMEGAEDSFRIGPKTSDVRVRFFPDHLAGEEVDGNRSHELVNPRFRTTVRLLGEEIFEGLLEPEQRVPLGDGREFFFLPDIRRYLLLDVIRETEVPIVFAVLGIMILGLLLRYARLRKEILVRVGSGVLHLYGRCEILESLFEEELDRLTVELNGASRPVGQLRTAS
jgi:hypothetical protein